MKRIFLPVACLLLLAAAAPQPKLTERQRALHALNRLAFGPRPGDVERVLAIGVDKWIEQQLRPESIADAEVEQRVAGLKTLQMSSEELIDTYYKPVLEARRAKGDGKGDGEQREMQVPMGQRPQRVAAELMSQRIVRAADSERQLNEVMVDFWFNHFNVLGTKGADRFLVTAYERDVIRPNMWGRFEDLLMATAKSPAMLAYLDNARSRRGALNENYAREIMELHTLGVDGGYTQKDVTELARVLTGWSVDRDSGTFRFRPFVHDRDAKTVLGVAIPAGGDIREGERMIRFLAHQPATARHIARKLAQRLVSDDPPKALVDRVAKTFLDTNGDIRQTVRAVVTSPEFWDARSYRAKVKTPFEYAISVIRASDATIINPLPIARGLREAGETLYGSVPPTGYSDAADAWMNSGALMLRLNFALALAANRLPGVDVPIGRIAAASEDVGKTIDALSQALIGGDLTKTTRHVIDERLHESKVSGEAQLRLIAGLILGSPEFQRQ